MALVINDRVKETSTSTGTGTFDLDGAVTGFDTFVAGIADGNTTYYAIFNQGTTEWEVGLGTVTDAATDTLARTTVLESSNSDSAVDFAAGTKDVFCTLPASKAVYLDGSGNPVNGVTFKEGGTNFTGGLLIGHNTTGTLSTAQNNTGVGLTALDAITQGDQNTAVGGNALTNLTTGSGNTVIGFYAALQTTIGNYNTVIGRSSGQSLSEGVYNTFLGGGAGQNITTGSGNVVIGWINADSTTADHQLKIGTSNGSSNVTWINGDSTGSVEITPVWNPTLSTTGKAFVMGF